MKFLKLTTATSVFAALLIGASQANAQTVTVDPATLTSAFMNWTPIPQLPGTGTGASGWGASDLASSFSGTTLTLSPNTIGDPAEYWYVGGGAPGNPGAKLMDANLYNETTGVYVGASLTFTADVIMNTLLSSVDQNGNGWTSVAFIKDFAPDYSSFTQVTAPLNTLGVFSINMVTSADAGHHIQYGFETVGPNVWATDPILAGLGNIVINPVPEPTTLALAGMGGMAALAFFRRRNK